jgi:hypothetical protein
MEIQTNILYYLRLRELGQLRRFMGKIVILARPNMDENCQMYSHIKY